VTTSVERGWDTVEQVSVDPYVFTIVDLGVVLDYEREWRSATRGRLEVVVDEDGEGERGNEW
jgi:hypothetical protein